MRNLFRSAVLALAVSGIGLGLSFPANAAEPQGKPADAEATVPVKAVVLFSSGVGYFEHVGHVTGNASTELQFKTNQINDILKSLVLQDMGGGKVTTVVYPSQDPLNRLLKSFQVDLTSNPSLADLLNQLRGAKVKVTAGTENLEGTILGLEKKPKAVEKGSIEVWVMNLVSGGTIRSVQMDDVTRLELENPQLQKELNKALAALASSRDQDKKPVTIHFEGQGDRVVRVGYVVETPIWKTSYRLLLGQNNEKNILQGWAIVENQTDNDWNDVQLSLVSGRPISFIQELYQPLYIPRPVVQPELYASLKPQTYEGGVVERERVALQAKSAAPAAPPVLSDSLAAGGRGVARRQAPGAAFGGYAAGEGLARPMNAAASVASVASAAKVGELFEYTVGSVTLPRQRSAMMPIITDPIDVERLSIYNASVLAHNPLNGAMLKNTTHKHLLAGPVTVIDGSTYAGDAEIDNLPPGQQRLLSYGIDLEMVVNASKNRSENSIVTGKIVKGVLQLSNKLVFTQEYIADNKSDKEKTLIIEHPFRPGWKLVEPEKPMETTDRLYRFKTTVPAGKSGTFTVKEETIQRQTIELLSYDLGSIQFYSRNGQIPDDVRNALAKAAQMRQNLMDLQRQAKEAQAEVDRITREQERIRENIKVAPEKSALQTRLLEKLNKQEDQVEALMKTIDQKQQAADEARKALEDYLNSLNVG